MSFQVSPGINISEIDLTTTVPAISTSIGAIAGVFNWGPIGKMSLVDTETNLVNRYGKPSGRNYETFFVGANFLAYSNALYVSRGAVVNGAYSNTVAAASANLNSNTTVILTGNTFGVAAGYAVFGTGIAVNTFVTSVSTNATSTVVTLSQNTSTSTDAQLNFFSNTYSLTAVANSDVVHLTDLIVINDDDFDHKGSENTVFANTQFIAKYPGALGNSLKVSMVNTVDQFGSSINMFSNASIGGAASSFVLNELAAASIEIDVNSAVANVVLTWDSGASTLTYSETKTTANTILHKLSVGDWVELGNTSIGTQVLKIKSLPSVTLDDASTKAYFAITFESTWNKSANAVSNTISRHWEYYNVVSSAPGTSLFVAGAGSTVVDEVSVVVVDEDGKFSGTPGAVLEVYENLSRATDATFEDGTSIFYKNVINQRSKYVWTTNDTSTAGSNTAINVIASTATAPYTMSFIGGYDGPGEGTISPVALANAYDLFADATKVDVSLVLAGKAGGTTSYQMANYLIDNIGESRKDCVVFISPNRDSVVNNSGSEAADIVTFRQSVHNSSYCFIDSGYKYQYDRYNDTYRYVPLNGDMAGLAARTDDLRDPWFSPAGFNRGNVKNLVRLAYNPSSKAERDLLYKNDVNSVVNFPGKGVILYGDKTGLGHASAFDRINVRRLFIILEKTIATAANQTLFEFNDEFTRAQFRNLVEPFLRDVQGRRGIYDFKVVCDESNNTGEVIDTNRFVGDIYVKAARSINFIQLNFVAVGTDVAFTEVVGKF